MMAPLLALPAKATEPAATPTVPSSLWLEDLTSPQVAKAIAQGSTRILIPTAGIEQNSKHLPLNKHAIVLRHTAQEIATTLGHTLIAPIMNYVPEKVHMPFAGTISLREETFYAVLRDTIESLAKHGFTHIYLLGDSGGNQEMQAKIADELSKKLRHSSTIMLASLHHYYAKNGQHKWLIQQGHSESDIGTHAAMRDTSEVMAIAPHLVHHDKICDGVWGDKSGGHGRATLATAAIGHTMLRLKVEAAIRQIKQLESHTPLPLGH